MNTPLHRPLSHPLRLAAVLVAGLALAGGAAAQWQWRDANGNRVFSDTPPPASVSERQIIKRPAGAPLPAAAAEAAPAAAAPAAKPEAAAPQRDAGLENKVKQNEDKQRKADDEKQAKIKADNCQRARQLQRTLDSGQRIARMNAQGEREFLDEKGLADERQRTQRAISENCV